MTIKKTGLTALIILTMWLLLTPGILSAQLTGDGVGQFIQIETHLHEFVGKPTWLLIIRDIDHNQNIPYMFDIRRGDNYWVALTYGKHYLIIASKLQIETYQSKYNEYKKYSINNFCHLESNGRIIRGKSMRIILRGNLTPNSASSICSVFKYPDADTFVVVPQNNP